jgi:hypothetical protein
MTRAAATAMKVASNDKGGGQAKAMRAMAVATTVVSKDEGNGNDNEGGGQQRG